MSKQVHLCLLRYLMYNRIVYISVKLSPLLSISKIYAWSSTINFIFSERSLYTENWYMTLRAQNERTKKNFYILYLYLCSSNISRYFLDFALYRLYREKWTIHASELFPFVFLATRVLNLSCRH